MPKSNKSDARNVILKVLNFCEQEAREQAPIIPFNQVYKRVSDATGLSQGLISKIVKEQETAQTTGMQIRTPSKKSHRKSSIIQVDDFDHGVIRRKIYEFYSVKKELPTIPKLSSLLKNEIDYKDHRGSLHKYTGGATT